MSLVLIYFTIINSSRIIISSQPSYLFILSFNPMNPTYFHSFIIPFFRYVAFLFLFYISSQMVEYIPILYSIIFFTSLLHPFLLQSHSILLYCASIFPNRVMLKFRYPHVGHVYVSSRNRVSVKRAVVKMSTFY